jgi:hypothetical protein
MSNRKILVCFIGSCPSRLSEKNARAPSLTATMRLQLNMGARQRGVSEIKAVRCISDDDQFGDRRCDPALENNEPVVAHVMPGGRPFYVAVTDNRNEDDRALLATLVRSV